jgi:2-amino-4-hydroxy-6-hydroxymethyldihydropteridine diphosphokinase
MLTILAIGSNLEPESNLIAALEALRRHGAVLAVSQVYQNAARGPNAEALPQPDYLNLALRFETHQTLDSLRQTLRRIEAQLGRVRGDDKYAARSIDIDLVLVHRGLPALDGWQVLDPEVSRRPHLAIPIADLIPQVRLEGLDRSLGEMAERLGPSSDLIVRPALSRRLREPPATQEAS